MNAPKLRFSEFNDEWKSFALGDITELSDGTHFTPNYKSSGIPFWSVETITTNAPVKYISEEEYKKINKRCNPQKNDILITRISSGINSLGVPKLVEWDTPFSIYVSVGLIKSSTLFDSRFLVEYVKTAIYKREFLSKSLLSASPKKINMNNLATTLVKLPSLQEQKKLGEFFSLLEKKIQLQQEKIDLLKEQKKGYMQKIFNQELRFKDENGKKYSDWTKCNFNDAFDIITDYVANGSFESIRNNVSYSEKEDFAYVVRLQDASNNWQGPFVYTNEHAYEFLKKTKLYPGDIIMSNVGSVGKFFKIPNLDKPMTLGPNALLLRSITNNSEFLYQLLNSDVFLKSLTKKITPGVQSKINKTDLKRIDISIPCIQEQTKIANFLSELDKKINIENKRLRMLTDQKQAFMQQMFV
ncbi:restriction endonuclease subunit S [Bacillus safensis]|uniref:restriction endonuclease subunit S n=1 Tax=Bacillus safensis TaxID=561879 RepID=UPI0035192E86